MRLHVEIGLLLDESSEVSSQLEAVFDTRNRVKRIHNSQEDVTRLIHGILAELIKEKACVVGVRVASSHG